MENVYEETPIIVSGGGVFLQTALWIENATLTFHKNHIIPIWYEWTVHG